MHNRRAHLPAQSDLDTVLARCRNRLHLQPDGHADGRHNIPRTIGTIVVMLLSLVAFCALILIMVPFFEKKRGVYWIKCRHFWICSRIHIIPGWIKAGYQPGTR